MAAQASHHAPSGRFIQGLPPHLGAAGGGRAHLPRLLGVALAALLARGSGCDGQSSTRAPRRANKALAEVGTVRRVVTEIQKDLGRVKDSIGQREAEDRRHKRALPHSRSASRRWRRLRRPGDARASAWAYRDDGKAAGEREQGHGREAPERHRAARHLRASSPSPRRPRRRRHRRSSPRQQHRRSSHPRSRRAASSRRRPSPSASPRSRRRGRLSPYSLRAGPSLDALRLSWSLPARPARRRARLAAAALRRATRRGRPLPPGGRPAAPARPMPTRSAPPWASASRRLLLHARTRRAAVGFPLPVFTGRGLG